MREYKISDGGIPHTTTDEHEAVAALRAAVRTPNPSSYFPWPAGTVLRFKDTDGLPDELRGGFGLVTEACGPRGRIVHFGPRGLLAWRWIDHDDVSAPWIFEQSPGAMQIDADRITPKA